MPLKMRREASWLRSLDICGMKITFQIIYIYIEREREADRKEKGFVLFCFMAYQPL